MRSLLEALLGIAQGAAAGSGRAPHEARNHYFAGMLGGSASDSGLSWQKAASQQNQYAQQALQGMGAKAALHANATYTVNYAPLPLTYQAEPVKPAEKVAEPEPLPVPGRFHYKPVELEAHDDFAVKLANR